MPSTIQRFLSFIGLSDEYFGDDEEYIEEPPRRQSRGAAPVSYTHLTLPTIYSV